MPHISRITRKNIIIFGIVTVLAAVLLVLGTKNSYCRVASALLHCAVIEAWAITVNARIINTRVRRLIEGNAVFLMLLFLLRICRYDFFADWPAVGRLFWYMYHVCFTAAPLMGFWYALNVYRTENEQPHKWSKYLVIPEILMCVVIMTNDSHEFMFRLLSDQAPNDGGYRYGWFYFVTLAWEFGFMIAYMVILVKKCRLFSSKRRWYIPFIPGALGCLGMVIFVIHGGIPEIAGYSLYSLSEAFALIVVGMTEGCIQIGLIPANSDYGEIFSAAHLDAALLDKQDNLAIRAGDILNQEDDENLRVGRQSIHGGYIVWTEDMTVINHLNEELEYAIEMIENENMLIEEENQSLEMRARYETMNRLYDHIADVVKKQLDVLDVLMKQDFQNGTEFRNALRDAVVYGAYIKRRANLEILSEGKEKLPAGELSNAIRESFEYLSLRGTNCLVDLKGDADISTDRIRFAYEMFEEVLEKVLDNVSFFYVNLHARETFSMQLTLERDRKVLSGEWNMMEQKRLGMGITQFVEDGILYIRLLERKGEIQ